MYLKRGGFFQNVLNLCAVFSDNAEIVSACLTRPILISVKRAEFSESVSREQNLVAAVIGHNYLGPVNHRSGYKRQSMFAEFKSVTLFYNDSSVRKIRAEKVFHHIKRLCRRNDLRIGVLFGESVNVCRMVGFHMLYNEIIWGLIAENIGEVVEPFIFKVCVNRIHYGNLFVKYDI